jgi:BirA family biotin operon repressor/biotin-[acetyl-CoA-carboxylase] ligase
LEPRLGTPRLHLRCVDSTNTRARELAIRGAQHGTLVTADEQTAGRGRQGRAWIAPPRSALLCSLVLRDPPALLPLAAGLAVAECVDALSGSAVAPAALKWPNDVLIDGRKVAGVLVEGRPQERWAVLGVGLNVAVRLEQLEPDLRARAATLDLDVSALERALTVLLARLSCWLSSDAQGRIAAAFANRDALRGRRIAWSAAGFPSPVHDERGGVAEGIDAAGRLIVRLDDGSLAAVDAGEVHLREAQADAGEG